MKRMGVQRKYKSQLDFDGFVGANRLLEVHIASINFTWTNRRLIFSNIVEKMDRFLFKGDLGTFPFSLEGNIVL